MTMANARLLIVMIMGVMFLSGPALCEEPVGSLVALELMGPDEVTEESETPYKAIAHYDDGGSKDVTDMATWSVDNDMIASIDQTGLLAAEAINYPQEIVTVYAEYSQGEITVGNEKEVTVLANCPAGSALDFEHEGDYVELAPGVLPVGNKSFFCWVKMPPVGQGSGTTYDYFIYIGLHNSGDFLFYFDNGVRLRCLNQASGGFDATYTVAIDDNKWHFLGFTYSDSTLRMYLDGSEVASSSGADISIVNRNESIGGQVGDTRQRYWYGKIDEAAIYDMALSAEQVQASMYTKLTGEEDGLVAYWAFDEGQGQTAGDSSGNGNYGTLGSTEDVDDNDPAWEAPGAPTKCTTRQVIDRNISHTIEQKQIILDELESALAKERATQQMLRQIQKDKDYSTWSPWQLVKARINIIRAIMKEYQSQQNIQQSVEYLQESQEVLTGPPIPPRCGYQRLRLPRMPR